MIIHIMYYHIGIIQHNRFVMGIIISASILFGMPYFVFMKSYEYTKLYLENIRNNYFSISEN